VDDEEKTLDLIEQAADDNHIVILTGGISVGDFDFVPEVLKKAGFEIHFRSLAVQPGKPSIFAVRGEKYLFALPGNPVSSFVQFELLVRHLINSCTGNRESEKTIRLPLGFDLQRKRTDRKAFIPVLITADGMIGQVEYHGSAHIHSFIHARGIVSIDMGVSEIRKGTVCDVRLL
jgi:molybdopterin molybdotransferase